GAVSSSLRLIGSHGRLTVDESQPTLDRWMRTERRGRAIGGEAGKHAVTAAITEFLRDIREERVPRVGAHDGWAIAVAIDAAYRSAACGQPVATPRRD
ncbi:MAG TPA: hypothetical protein VFI22_02850, partial [Thermomicrobiales bacterium]|nr:hypothetical protein [Thermomicrobiales bacterium]